MGGGVGVRFLGRIGEIGWLLRKNRIENGSRADPRGSKPHSYGDNFSWSGFIWVSHRLSVIRVMLRIREVVNISEIVFIALLWV